MDTPPLLRVAKYEFLWTIFSSKWNQQLLHSGFPPVCYRAGNRGVPILFALRLPPLLFILLSAEARARPGRRPCQEGGPTSAPRLVRVLAHLRPSSSSPRRKPRMGTRSVCTLCAAAGPGTCKMVSGSCSARLSVCVCASKGARVFGMRGVRCVCARLREGLAAAGAGTDSPGGARAAPHTKPLASPLTPTPPTPLSSHPHPPRPLPSSLIGQWDKSFCGDGWALTSRAELSHLGIPGAVRMLQAAG